MIYAISSFSIRQVGPFFLLLLITCPENKSVKSYEIRNTTMPNIAVDFSSTLAWFRKYT